MKRIKHKLLWTLLAVIIFNMIVLGASVLIKPPLESCNDPNLTHQALGDWDTTVACSTYERTVEGLFYQFGAPFAILWPATLLIIVSPVVSTAFHRRISWQVLRPAIMGIILVLQLSALVHMFFFIAA